jgi:hypothetical protein
MVVFVATEIEPVTFASPSGAIVVPSYVIVVQMAGPAESKLPRTRHEILPSTRLQQTSPFTSPALRS